MASLCTTLRAMQPTAVAELCTPQAATPPAEAEAAEAEAEPAAAADEKDEIVD